MSDQTDEVRILKAEIESLKAQLKSQGAARGGSGGDVEMFMFFRKRPYL
jgi:hypothetical protein